MAAVVRYFLYGLVLTTGIFLRFSTPLTTLFDLDSTGYLLPALKLLLAGDFDHIYGRSYPYPLFLSALLFVFKNINAVCVAQHLLGIITAVALVVWLERKFKAQLVSGKNEWLFTIIAVLLLGTVFLNGNIITFEKSLRPEGIIMPSVFLLLIALSAYADNNVPKVRTRLYFFNFFLLCFFSLLHPRMSAAFLMTAFVVCVYQIKWASPRRILSVFTTLVASVIILLLCWLPERYLVKNYDLRTDAFAYRQMFYSHAGVVVNAIDNGAFVEKEYDQNFLKPDFEKVLTDKADAGGFPLLGYNIDRLQYSQTGNYLIYYIAGDILKKYSAVVKPDYKPTFADTLKIKNETDERYNHYYKTWFGILVKQYPAQVAAKTMRQMGLLFVHPQVDFIKMPLPSQEHQGFEKDREPYFGFLTTQLNYKPDEVIAIGYPQWLYVFCNILSPLLRLLFPLSLLYYLFLLFKRRLSLLPSVLFLLTIVSLLTVALLHTFDTVRYLYSLLPLIAIVIFYALFDVFLLKSFRARN